MSQAERGEWVIDPGYRIDLSPPDTGVTMTFRDLPQEVIDLFTGQDDGSGKPCRIGVYAAGAECGESDDGMTEPDRELFEQVERGETE